MARKRDLANKLSNEPAPRPGWRDTIGPPPVQQPERDGTVDEPRGLDNSGRGARSRSSERSRGAETTRRRGTVVEPAPVQEQEEEDPQKLKRKTYLLTQELIERIALLADQERVGINELVRFLLTEAVISVENGELEIPTGPAKRQIIQ